MSVDLAEQSGDVQFLLDGLIDRSVVIPAPGAGRAIVITSLNFARTSGSGIYGLERDDEGVVVPATVTWQLSAKWEYSRPGWFRLPENQGLRATVGSTTTLWVAGTYRIVSV